jgi:catalase (peroxidase I)
LIFTGLINALKLIQPIKDKYPGITYADLFQLASATAIEVIVLSLLKYLTWSFDQSSLCSNMFGQSHNTGSWWPENSNEIWAG